MRSPNYVLKEGVWFACFGDDGGISPGSEGLEGVYYRDARVMDRMQFSYAGHALEAVWVDQSATHRLRFLLANQSFPALLAPGSLLLRSTRATVNDGYLDVLALSNHSEETIAGDFEIALGFEFADLAEVRGILRDRWQRAVHVEPEDRQTLAARYESESGAETTVRLHVSVPFEWRGDGVLRFPLALAPDDEFALTISIGVPAPPAAGAMKTLERSVQEWRDTLPSIETNHETTNDVLARSADDLRALWTWTGEDSGYFAAGIPHFVACFGRDGLIASLEFLMAHPRQARWVLRELARHQGKKLCEQSEEEPGKILHELRGGERTGPDDYPYTYATTDASLLFPMLLDEYLRWSGDLSLVRELEPVLRGILAWCERYGDANGDGFYDYLNPKNGRLGLVHRGWKDGEPAAVTMGDGTQPAFPVAMAEFQGYAHNAFVGCARMFRLLGDEQTADACQERADDLQRRFDEAFWWSEQQCFAMGLAGDGRQVDTVGTNQGHCLIGDLIAPDKRSAVADRLLEDDSFTGFGLRTLVRGSTAYSPFRYQRGGAWPHDSSLVAYGLHTHGFRKHGNRIAAGLLRAAGQFPQQRLPELFAGLSALETGGRVVPVSIACRPQAWAAASPFLLMRGILGVQVDALARRVTLNPDLTGLPFTSVRVRGLGVIDGGLSFDVEMEGERTVVSGVAVDGEFEVGVLAT